MCAPEFKKTQLTKFCCKSDACGGSRYDDGRKHWLGRIANAKSMKASLAFWLLERGPRASISLERCHSLVDF
jgi:hypothetical protein